MKKDGGETGDEVDNGKPLCCIIALDLVVLTAKPQVSALVKRLIKSCNNEWLWQVALRSSANISSVMVIVKGRFLRKSFPSIL